MRFLNLIYFFFVYKFFFFFLVNFLCTRSEGEREAECNIFLVYKFGGRVGRVLTSKFVLLPFFPLFWFYCFLLCRNS